MKRRAQIKPSKSGSAAAVFVGIGMLGFGLFVLTQISGKPKPSGFTDFPGSPGPSNSSSDGFGTAFFLFWLVCVCIVIAFHLSNVLGKDGVATEIIEYESEESKTVPDSAPMASNAADQLRELQQLREENLISIDEYEQKRAEILRRI